MTAPSSSLPDSSAQLRRQLDGMGFRRSQRGQSTVASVTLVALLVFIVPPLIMLLYTSFRSGAPGTADAVWTLDAWRHFFSPATLIGLRNTVVVAGLTTLLAVPGGLFFAWLEAQTDAPLAKRLSSFLIIPLIFSPLLTTVAWTVLAAPRSGLINVFVNNTLGIEEFFDIYSLQGMVLVSTLYFTPVAYLATRSSLRGIDASTIEAARISGASLQHALRRVLLPLLAPAVGAASMLVFTMGIGLFSVVTLLGPNARVSTLQLQVFLNMAESPTDPPRAAAIAVSLLVITAINMTIYSRYLRGSHRFRTVTGKGFQPVNIKLGLGKYLVFALTLGYVLMAILLPYMALVYGAFVPFLTPEFNFGMMGLGNFEQVFDNPQAVRSFRNTALLVFVGGTVTTIIATTIGYLSKRMRGALPKTLEVVALLPLALPGLAFALGLLWFSLSFALARDAIYGTIVLIYIGQMASFLPLGVQIIGAGVVQLGPDMEDAAKISGAGGLDRIRRILIPMLKPSIASAWLILALYASVEAGLSVFLYTGQSITAAVTVFINAYAGTPSIMYATAVILATFGLVAIAIGNYFFGAARQFSNR